MNMHRPHSRRRLLRAAALLGLLSAVSLAQAEPPGETAGSRPSTPAPEAATPAPGRAAQAAPAEDATDAAFPAPTATAKAPATLVIDRQGTGKDAFLDLNVRAFKPPKHGAVEAVVTLEENKDGGREVDVGRFSIFPSKKFEATKPEDERGFRLNATEALNDLGGDSADVKVKVRLSPLHEGQSAHGAKLTLGKVQFVPRDDPR
jgi:hypothetical protein